MPEGNQQITKEQFHLLLKCIAIIVNLAPTELTYRNVLSAAGFTGLAQAVTSPGLKQARDSFIDNPLQRINVLAPLVPESIIKAMAVVIDTYFNAKIISQYNADMTAISDLQVKLTDSTQECYRFDAELKQKIDELDQLKVTLDTANSNLNNQLDRNKQLEVEKIRLEGRLQERESVARRKSKNAAPTDLAADDSFINKTTRRSANKKKFVVPTVASDTAAPKAENTPVA